MNVIIILLVSILSIHMLMLIVKVIITSRIELLLLLSIINISLLLLVTIV